MTPADIYYVDWRCRHHRSKQTVLSCFQSSRGDSIDHATGERW